MTGDRVERELTADQVDLVRRRILNVVGHELRTPVTALAGLARELATADVEHVRDTLGPAIERLADRTEALLDDLLMASGIATALPVDSESPVEVATGVRAAWDALSDATIGRELHIDEAEADLVAAVGDEGLHRCLTHVLSNALAYGDGPVHVTVSRAGDAIRCEVRHAATGPKDDELDLVFEPFFRGEHAVMRGAGLGLGLAVSRSILDSAGGTISLRRDGDDTVTTLDLRASA